MDPRTAKMLAEREGLAAFAPPAPGPRARVVADSIEWAKAHKITATMASAAAIILVFVAFYALVVRPVQRREQLAAAAMTAERLQAQTATRQALLNDCLSKTQTESQARWTATCKTRGQKVGCILSGPLTEALDRQEGQARNSCLLRFSLTQ